MGKRGDTKYIPYSVLCELDRIKKWKGLKTNSEAWEQLVATSRVGRKDVEPNMSAFSDGRAEGIRKKKKRDMDLFGGLLD